MKERADYHPHSGKPERFARPGSGGHWRAQAQMSAKLKDSYRSFMQKTCQFLQPRYEPIRSERHREADVQHRAGEGDPRDQRCNVSIRHNPMLSNGK
jgi:hypothetical protein